MTGACAAEVTATGRVGNGGNASLPATAALELVEVGPAGERLLARETLAAPLAPGAFEDLTVRGAPTAGEELTFLARLTLLPGGPAIATSAALPSLRCDDGAPLFTSSPPVSLAAGGTLAYQALAVDPEGLAVTYQLLAGPPGASIVGNTGLLRYAPASAGTVGFSILAADPAGNSALQQFTVALAGAAGCATDADGDGSCAGTDCDDSSALVGPGRPELPGNGIDDDCSALTPDSVPFGAAALSLLPDAATFPSGSRLGLSAVVENRGQLLTIAGAEVELLVDCPGGASPDLTALTAAPPVGPGGSRAVRFALDAAGLSGACTARAFLNAGPDRLADATAVFSIRSTLSGQLSAAPQSVDRGAPVELTYELQGDPGADVDATVLLRVPGLGQPLATASHLVPAGGSAPGSVTVDTRPLAPALYVVTLESSSTPLATTAFRVRQRAVVGAPFVAALPAAGELLADTGAAPSAVSFRPTGRSPGARESAAGSAPPGPAPSWWWRSRWTTPRSILETRWSWPWRQAGAAAPLL